MHAVNACINLWGIRIGLWHHRLMHALTAWDIKFQVCLGYTFTPATLFKASAVTIVLFSFFSMAANNAQSLLQFWAIRVCKDKHWMTGANLGTVVNSRSGCMHSMHLCWYGAKLSYPKLKTQPTQFLGFPLWYSIPSLAQLFNSRSGCMFAMRLPCSTAICPNRGAW